VRLLVAICCRSLIFARIAAVTEKRSSGIANPDRQYYAGAARGCGGAYCYRSDNHKRSKMQ
jgi:hypothetical protein